MARYDDDGVDEYEQAAGKRGGARCVDCGRALCDGLAGPGLPRACYGPPAPDWFTRCPACYGVLTDGGVMTYVAGPRRDKRGWAEYRDGLLAPSMAVWHAEQALRGMDRRVASVQKPEHLLDTDQLAAVLVRLYAWGREG